MRMNRRGSVRIGGWCLGLSMAMVGTLVRADEGSVPPATPSTTPAEPKAELPFLGGFLRETRIVYPLQVGEWKAVGEHLYEQQELGVSVRYMHDKDVDRWIDLYFYPAGVLPEGDFEKIAANEREGLRQARIQAGLPEPDMGELRTFSFEQRAEDGKTHRKQGFSTDLSFEFEGQQKSSAMTLMLERMYLIKGRFSAPVARLSRNDTRGMLEGFMAHLLPRLTIDSSGGCWMPLPIERLADGQPPPEKSLASMDKEGASKVYLLADRVLATNPDSVEARVMMTLGMVQLGRLFPGCVGSDPVNPVVPGDMREIRLEYRAPADEGPPQDRFRLEGRKRGDA